MKIVSRVAATVIAAFVMMPDARAVDLKVMVTGAARDAFNEIAPQFERASGHTLAAQFDLPPSFFRKIAAGETFDVIILSMDVEGLIKEGKVAADSRTVLGRTGVGVAIHQGARKPDFSTVDAFKRMLLDASAVTYSGEGSSGRYFLSLLDRLGMTDVIKPKLRPPSGVGGAAVLVANGGAELAVIGRTPTVGVAGVEWAGLLPAELQNWVVFTAGVSSATKEAAASRTLLDFLTTPAATAVLKAKGIDPVTP